MTRCIKWMWHSPKYKMVIISDLPMAIKIKHKDCNLFAWKGKSASAPKTTYMYLEIMDP